MVERRVRSRDAAHALPLQPNLDVPLAEFQRPANAVGSQLPLTPVLVEGADRHVQALGSLAHADQPVAAAEPRCHTACCAGLFATALVLSHGSPLTFHRPAPAREPLPCRLVTRSASVALAVVGAASRQTWLRPAPSRKVAGAGC